MKRAPVFIGDYTSDFAKSHCFKFPVKRLPCKGEPESYIECQECIKHGKYPKAKRVHAKKDN